MSENKKPVGSQDNSSGLNKIKKGEKAKYSPTDIINYMKLILILKLKKKFSAGGLELSQKRQKIGKRKIALRIRARASSDPMMNRTNTIAEKPFIDVNNNNSEQPDANNNNTEQPDANNNNTEQPDANNNNVEQPDANNTNNS